MSTLSYKVVTQPLKWHLVPVSEAGIEASLYFGQGSLCPCSRVELTSQLGPEALASNKWAEGPLVPPLRPQSTNQCIVCVCVCVHMQFAYWERAYLELGLRGGMCFLKNTNFFHMNYPVGFAMVWFFSLSWIWFVGCLFWMWCEELASWDFILTDRACLGHSLS